MSKRSNETMESKDCQRNVAICMGPYKKLRRGPRKTKLPVMVMMSTLHPYEVWYLIDFSSKYEANIMVIFNIGFQKKSGGTTHLRSIAYFQEDEEYYGKGPMLNDDFICQTAFKNDEFGHCDKDFRMTPHGRAYLRMKSI